MKAVKNFYKELNGKRVQINGKWFRLEAPNDPTVIQDADNSQIWIFAQRDDLSGKEPFQYCLRMEIRWSTQHIQFVRYIVGNGTMNGVILNSHRRFLSEDCRDRDTFINRIICRNVDRFLSNGSFC